MKKVTTISLLVFLVGCDQAKEEYKEMTNEENYFSCIDINSKVEPPLESALLINLKEKTLEFMGFPYANLSYLSETILGANSAIINDEDTYLRLNRVTGELTLYTAGGSVFFYECKRAKPLF